MIRVAIETSTRVGSVAVGRDGDVLADVELGEQTRHAAAALPALDRALRSAGAARSDIGAVVVGAGPGSFTGVRVAGATAKGLATSLGVPLLAYSSLLALAADRLAAEADGTAVCGLFDARRGEVYAGCWGTAARGPGPEDRGGDGALTELLAPMVGLVAAVVGALASRGARDVAFVGDGVARYGDELAAAMAAEGLDGRVGAGDARPTASSLLRLAHRHEAMGRVADVAAWEPLYVRGSGAERGLKG